MCSILIGYSFVLYNKSDSSRTCKIGKMWTSNNYSDIVDLKLIFEHIVVDLKLIFEHIVPFVNQKLNSFCIFACHEKNWVLKMTLPCITFMLHLRFCVAILHLLSHKFCDSMFVSISVKKIFFQKPRNFLFFFFFFFYLRFGPRRSFYEKSSGVLRTKL